MTLSPEMIMEALRDGYTAKCEGGEIVIFRTISETLLQEASAATGITVHRLRGAERSRPISMARFAIFWTMREYSGLSLPQIGKAIGNRDHTTVMHACRRAKALRETDLEFKALCDRLEATARQPSLRVVEQ